MPKKKEVVEDKEKKTTDNTKILESMLDKIDRIERLIIIVWSLSILSFMLSIFCLFK